MPFQHLDQSLRESVKRHPHALAYSFMGREVTYEQLDHDVSHVSAFFHSLGLTHGDGLALILPNSDAFVTIYHAALRLGMYCVPINPTYTIQEIFYLLQDSQVKVVVAPHQMAQLAGPLLGMMPGLHLIAVGQPEGELPHGIITYQSIIDEPSYPEFTIQQALDPEDLAVILYTSGTTGKPKGAMLTHTNLSSNADLIGDHLELTQEDHVLVVLPMFHVFCLTVCLNASIYRGAHMVILPRFSPIDTLTVMQNEKITLFAGVPTMYNFMLQAARDQSFDLSSIRYCLSGGAAMPEAVQRGFEQKFGVVILEGYGLSEASPVTCFAPVDGRPRKVGSIGLALPMVEQKIVDLQDEEVPVGSVGELVVRGPNVMKGYWHREEETNIALRNGWLHTGDLAKVDEDGYFYIVDRKKDMIIVGGFNVYPREVEEVLFLHPAIQEAAVVGVRDDNYGESVVACIVQKDATLTEQAIIDYCHEHLAKYKCPTKVVLYDELPKNTTGKVMRRVLREQMQV